MRQVRQRLWWQYLRHRPELYETIGDLDRVLAKALTSKHHAFAFLPRGLVYDQTGPIFAFDTTNWFAVLQSDIHAHWALDYGASLETRPRYTPSDCFETFPFPPMTEELSVLGEQYHGRRREMMLARQEGLTKLYNRFSNPNEHSDDVEDLRHRHLQINQAVCRAYGWDNIELGQGFRETKAGLRYTISELAWQDIRDRLLELNHRLHDTEAPTEAVSSPAMRKRRVSKKGKLGEPDLFG